MALIIERLREMTKNLQDFFSKRKKILLKPKKKVSDATGHSIFSGISVQV